MSRRTHLQLGDRVALDFSDPNLPEGTEGTVQQTYTDYGDGVDVLLDDGRLVNTLCTNLSRLQRS
ncbi:hypothetical protein ACFV3R_33080 [Streptomyces sp. NPDC059740]|uniref:hypothetical protein n=1 Tax=Streptomyces sp. NPDC059740 TaxID=3346926 RepID=UPI0036688B63